MAALPDNFVDTGITATHTLEFDVEFRAQFHDTPGSAYFDFEGLSAFGVRVYTSPASPPLGNPDLGADWDSANSVEILLDQAGALSTLGSDTGSASGDPGLIGTAVHCERETTNVRLGVKINAAEELEYRWFRDSGSTTTWQIGGTTVRTQAHSEPPEDLGSGGQLLVMNTVGVVAGNPVFSMCVVSGFLSQGAAMAGVGPLSDPTSYFVGLTWNWTTDLRAVDENGADTLATDTLYDGVVVTTPATPTRSVVQDWGTAPPAVRERRVTAAELTDPWLSAQTVAPDLVDRPYTFEGNRPKSPSSAFTTWNVGSLTLAANRDVLLASVAWTGTNATISANTPPLDIVVAATPAQVERVLSESWQDWNDPLDADFEADDLWTTTDHDFYASGAADDVWGWSGFAFLNLVFSAAPAATLSLEIDWVAIREDFSLLTVTRTYTVAVNGAGTYTVDLLLPNEGAVPFFGERVRAFRLSGFAVGTYTLTQMRLVCTLDAYLKLGSPRLGEPQGVMLSQDGQFCFSQWNGDESRGVGVDDDSDDLEDHVKDQQNGVFFVAPDEITDPDTEFLGGAAAMTNDGGHTLTEWFAELPRMERVSASYSSAAILAALSDGFMTQIKSITTYPSYWLLPNLPHERVAPGGSATLLARLVVADVVVPAGLAAASFIAYQRNRLGCALEALGVTAARARVAAGTTVTARAGRGAPLSSDPTLDTATTDAGGFVTLSIRTGSLKLSTGAYEAFEAYLA